jgi:hypothetical protein
MTAGEITAALLRDRWKRNFCLPRFTPAGWWEADVFELTRAGYWREYEVKVTRADFRKDAEKARHKVVKVEGPADGRKRKLELRRNSKHDLLAARDTSGPTQFWFVCPVGLIAPDEVPEWAGLLHMHDSGRGPKKYRIWDTVVKAAPRLHGEKCSAKVVEKARESCYWRLHAAWGTATDVHEPADYEI